MIQFVQMTLTPIARQYEQEMNRKLLNKDERQEAGENAHLIGTKIYKASDNSIIEDAITALLLGKNILLKGPTGSGKTVLAETLSSLFQNQCIALTALST